LNSGTNSQINDCPVCGWKLKAVSTGGFDRYDINCKRCGQYSISGTAISCLGSPHAANSLFNTDVKKAAAGYWLRSHQLGGVVPTLTSKRAIKIADQVWFPSLVDQYENLLRLLAATVDGPGAKIELRSDVDQYCVGCRSPFHIGAILERMRSDGLIDFQHIQALGRQSDEYVIEITFDGWLAYEELDRGGTKGKLAFMAMPFNQPDLEEEWLPRLRSAVAETGFTLRRVDDVPTPGLIDVRMRLEIKQARFLIVELTHANNGAYWEAGYAEGLGKPVIYTCKKGDKAHFDVDHSLRIEWDPAQIDDALARLKATIRNALPDAKNEQIKG
jgi:hypothetical protein